MAYLGGLSVSVYGRQYSRQIRLRPSEINYSQRKIIQLFGNGWKSLPETFGEIVAGKLTVDDLPPISVFVHRNVWWVYSGNRRLRVFKELEKYGLTQTIPVLVVSNPMAIKDPTWPYVNTVARGGPNIVVHTLRGQRQIPISYKFAWKYYANKYRRVGNAFVYTVAFILGLFILVQFLLCISVLGSKRLKKA